ncbi:MAG: hypothetical protein ACLUMK_09605 [Christensenellales bacterium]
MKKMWALVLAVWMVSLNIMAVAEEGGAEPFELKEYHMNLERFRGEPDNMIDSDGNIIFGNAATRVSMTFNSDYGDKCSYNSQRNNIINWD